MITEMDAQGGHGWWVDLGNLDLLTTRVENNGARSEITMTNPAIGRGNTDIIRYKLAFLRTHEYGQSTLAGLICEPH